MRVLVCGDRHWENEERIRDVLCEVNPKVIIEGGAKGADRIAWKIGREGHLTVIEFQANWEKYGRAAGPIRNETMLRKGKPQLVLAFHNKINESLGTRNMVMLALSHKVPVRIFTEKSELKRVMIMGQWVKLCQ